jgi:hypothetical protein
MDYDDWLSEIYDAAEEFNDMSPEERSAYYDEFFDYWDLDDEQLSVFWEMYDQAG